MNKEVSHRCGANCEHSCPMHIKDSRCLIYDDRRECSKSMKQRKKSAYNSRKRNKLYPQVIFG